MATSARPYQQDARKYAKSADTFKRPRQMASNPQHKSERLRSQMIVWTTFYRRNIHRFAQHYLGLKLHFFQYVMLYLMSQSTTFMTIASRGISKSFTIAIYACAKAILYPKSIIVIVSGNKGQASLIVTEKIKNELMKMSPNLCREIDSLNTGQNNISVIFKNGSRILVVVSGDGARGKKLPSM